ncbi:MAG: hypothetical protein QNJ71_11145 [Acidimicrobiia bacterium]|nr:hypothetical protein [Acidimicrobiia bacterium]
MERRHKDGASTTFETDAIEAWNMLGGQIDWSALPVICDILDIVDPETLARDLVTMRDHFARQTKHG